MSEHPENLIDVEEIARLMKQAGKLSVSTGYILFWWGLLLTAASLIGRFLLDNESELFQYIFPATCLIGWLGGVIVNRTFKLKSRDGEVAYGNSVSRSVWVASGLVITSLLVLNFLGYQASEDSLFSIVALVCAISLVATAAACETNILFFAASGWAATAIYAYALPATTEALLVYSAAACFLFLALPGLSIALRR